ncbi:hypothetical protein BLNAU_3938 [Blattamonas nauphoetae]|uniref:Serpin domain-containing protein n=1 Tax=Blattamonas nauphoetae TaxID=2049346 RepID=A0ABQ9YBS0_9EUKA|nr:hypothetical protein BLNAU_3938 [Blattamonas nauphoetae]
MGVAFSDAAEFPRISPQPLKIDQLIHKTVVKVAENGVEGAAATAVMMGLLMMPPPEAPVPQLVFDRPLIVALADKRNDLVFFERLVTSLALFRSLPSLLLALMHPSKISSLLERLQCDDEDIIVDTLRELQKVASGVYS